MSELAQRYGSPPRARRALTVAGVAVLAAAALAWLLWAMLAHSSPAVQSELVSFRPPAEHAVVARVTVARQDRQVTASCLLRAQASDHSVVGELRFRVGPSAPATATLAKTVRTERRATTVDLLGCTADGQQRPR